MAFGFGFALTAIAKAVGFTPRSLFTSGAQGAWYDPSDYSTLYEDSSGTIPITSPLEKPVGLMLDKSKGLVLGPELVTNGDFSNGTTGWAAEGSNSIAVVGGELEVTLNSPIFNGASGTNYSLTVGKTYIATATGRRGTSATFVVRFGSGVGEGDITFSSTTKETKTRIFVATTATVSPRVLTATNSAGTIYADNISVRELPGNHATQSTTTSRPTLSARYNLLTKTEQFDDAAWTKAANAAIQANQTTAPDGTTTADLYTSSGASDGVYQTVSGLTASIPTTLTIKFKAGTGRWIRITYYDGSNGIRAWVDVANKSAGSTGTLGTGGSVTSFSCDDIGDGWVKANIVAVVPGATRYVQFASADANSSFGQANGTYYVWGADLRVANDGIGLPAYQRVNTATNYDYAGFPPYLKFDGTDDGMATGSIDFTGTDKMSVFAGVRKLSDGAAAILVELSANGYASNGGMYISAPNTAAANTAAANFGFVSGGTTRQYVEPSGYAAPTTKVLSGLGDISGDSAILRLNGTQVAQSTADQGTGNYGNYPLYIGRRNNVSLPYNGRLYSLVVVGKLASAAEITSTENWIEAKTFGKDMNYVYSDEVLTAASEQITTADGQNVYMTVTYQ